MFKAVGGNVSTNMGGQDKKAEIVRDNNKMKRNIDLNEISDGRLYTANDMVKADCHDCK